MGPRACLDGREKLALTGNRSPNLLSRSDSLYRSSHPGPRLTNVDIENDPIKLSKLRFYELSIIVIGRERDVDISVTNGSIFGVTIVCKIFKILLFQAHVPNGRSADFFIYSIRHPDAFAARECLTLDQALSGSYTGTATAFMGDRIRFQ